MPGGRSGRVWAIAGAAILFCVFCVLPVAYVTATALGWRSLTTFSLDARQQTLLLNTTMLGTGVALIASLIGVPIGIALARVSMARKTLLRVLLAAPLLLPPYIIALAWIYLAGGDGWAYGMVPSIFILGLAFYPISMLATEAGVRRVDGRLEEAALIAASPRRVLTRITIPLALPAVLAATLVVFVMAISEFGVPGLLGTPVYTTEVFTAFAALYDTGRAAVLAAPLLALTLVASLGAGWLIGDRIVVPRRASGATHVLFASRLASVMALGVMAIALGIPIAVLVGEAASPDAVATVAGTFGPAVRSVLLAATAATVAVAIAAVVGYARARLGTRRGIGADMLFLVLFAVPGTVAGIGLIGVWNRDGVIGSAYGTDVMFVLGYLARFMPIAALALGAAARYVPGSHEEAAAISGASWRSTMRRIVLPQMTLGAAAAWIVVFVLAFGELAVSILVAPPGADTLPVRIYTLIANTPASHVAMLALVQAAIVLAPLAVLGYASSGRRFA